MWIALSTLALAQDAPPIVGGEETDRFKPVGALVALKGQSGGQFCSGTLVSGNRVVTAAHCIEAGWEYEDYGYDVYFVLTEDVYDGWDDYKVAKDLIAHPDYDRNNLRHDIGLMKLDGSITSVGNMRLNTEALKTGQKGDTVTYVGFGSLTQSGGGSGVKRTVDVELWDYDTQFLYTGYSGNAVKNVCPGDSGGAALMWRADEEVYELVGANSFVFNWVDNSTYDCHAGDAGGAATRIDKNLDFLGEYMDIELEGEGDADTDSDADSDTDSDADTDSDTDTDLPESGDTATDEEPPELTPGGGCGCSGAGGLGGLAAVVLAGLVATRRRR
jgi:uncharacterized protein (TIGR03382 family)